MDAENHPDPFQEATQAGFRHAMELAYAVGAGTQVYLHHKAKQARIAAERDQRARRALNAELGAQRDAARAGWAPALDREWLSQADLLQTGRAWAAAMPYADRAVPWYEPAAAAAMRRCEERLRHLHPQAMARYDRLRAGNVPPAEAMRQTAPLFTRPPRVYDGYFTPRPVLHHGNGPAGPATPGGPEPRARPGAPATPPAAGPRPWERDFPLPIRDVMAAAAGRGAMAAAPVAARVPAVAPVRGPPAMRASDCRSYVR